MDTKTLYSPLRSQTRWLVAISVPKKNLGNFNSLLYVFPCNCAFINENNLGLSWSLHFIICWNYLAEASARTSSCICSLPFRTDTHSLVSTYAWRRPHEGPYSLYSIVQLDNILNSCVVSVTLDPIVYHLSCHIPFHTILFSVIQFYTIPFKFIPLYGLYAIIHNFVCTCHTVTHIYIVLRMEMCVMNK